LIIIALAITNILINREKDIIKLFFAIFYILFILPITMKIKKIKN